MRPSVEPIRFAALGAGTCALGLAILSSYVWSVGSVGNGVASSLGALGFALLALALWQPERPDTLLRAGAGIAIVAVSRLVSTAAWGAQGNAENALRSMLTLFAFVPAAVLWLGAARGRFPVGRAVLALRYGSLAGAFLAAYVLWSLLDGAPGPLVLGFATWAIGLVVLSLYIETPRSHAIGLVPAAPENPARLLGS